MTSGSAPLRKCHLYRDETCSSGFAHLPLCLYPAFRREAGSYGRDTRGLIRLHQFNKVELFKFVHPDTSEQEHQTQSKTPRQSCRHCRPYRIVELCTDLGFSKTYDLSGCRHLANTVKSPAAQIVAIFKRGVVVFALRAGKRHSICPYAQWFWLVGRTMAAILENYQQPDRTVRVPEALQPHLKREVLTD